MSKYVLFFILLLSLNASAQEAVTAKATPSAQKTKWDEQEPFVNGFARVLQNRKFSFINKSGNLVTPLQFEAARNFKNHLAAVKKDGKWGFIDESGTVIIPFKYDIVFDFTENITGVFGNKRWWLINTQAQVVKALDVNVFYGFKNGIAKIEKNERTGTININGEVIFDKTQNNKQAPASNAAPYHTTANSATSTITICPDNIDFEYGSFFNWDCYIGHVDSIVNVNVITLNPSPPTPNRHTLYNKVLPSAIDPYGLFPTNPPDGSNFALRLGNTQIGGEAEGVKYKIHVPLNDSNFSIKYDYAVVFEDPGHTLWSQPRFQVKVFDSAANSYVDCASFEYVSTSGLPGFTRSTVDTGVIYKPWSSVFLSLRGYAGKTMILEFNNADCVRKGHWGYSYIDVEKPCGQSVAMDYDCADPHITTLDAPPGFQIYNWWNQTFDTLLATGQHVVLNPGPQVNTTVWLEMIPFNNFGCLDTIPVKITGEFTAHFTQSDTLGLCAPHTFTFYNRDVPSQTAIWDFGDGTTGSGDTVTHTYTAAGSYLVSLHVVMPGGCIGNTVQLVSVVQPAGSFSFTGGTYCSNPSVQFNAVVSNADTLIWDFGDGTILHTTQVDPVHVYTAPGTYIPKLTIKALSGCETPLPIFDTIKIDQLKTGFIYSDVKTCGSTTVNFRDTSSAYFGITSRQWDFGDGTTGSGINVSHTYTTSGTYTITLTVNGNSGCNDVVTKQITVQVNNVPVAAIDGDTDQCQSVPVTFNSNVVSADAINYYHWTSSNGAIGASSSFVVNFATPGVYTIQLIVGTVNGCFDTTTHTVTIHPTPDVLQPPSQTLCNGDFAAATNFSGSVAGTIYNWTNTAPSIGLAASGSGNIPSFQVINNNTTTANATIRVTPVASGCPGPQKTFIITIYPTPNVAQPTDQTLCAGSNTAAINFSGTVAGAVYQWSNNNTSIGLAASGTGNIPSFTANSNAGTVNTATITVTPMMNGCPGTPKTFTITANPMPAVNQPTDQDLCSGNYTTAVNFSGPVAGTLYSWTNSNTIIGLAANGTGNIPSFQASSNGSSVATATITVTPSINGCTAPPKSFTITVNPAPNVAQPADQSLCDNSNTAAINFSGTVGGTVYQWTNSNTSIGLAASGNGNIPSFTASSNGNSNNTATITVTPMMNGCPGTPRTFTITVKPVPAVNQPADQQLCSGSFTSPINFTGPVTGTLYSWNNSNTVIGLAASGTGDIAAFQASANGNNVATSTITVTPSLNGCASPAKTFTITVNPTPNVLQPADQALCDNSNTAAINFSGSVSGTVYNWTNSNTSIGLAASGSGNIASFAASSNGNTANTATITVTPTVNGCPGTPKTFTITVNPVPAVNQPADQALCSGNFTTAVNFSGPVSGTVYSWTNNNTAIGLAANGSGNIPSFQALASGNAVTTATITVTPSLNGCSSPAKTFTITVSPSPAVAQPADQALCDNSNTAAINFSGPVSGTIYNWTNSNTSIGLAANGTGNIASFVASSNGSSSNTATITVTPTINGCAGTPKTFTITVNPVPAVNQPADQDLCSGSFTSPINFNGPVSGTVYNWTNTNTVIGLAANGNGNIASFQAAANGVSAATATITVTPSFNGCAAPPKTFTITVNPTPDVVQPADQALCNNSNTAAINFSGAVPGTVYNWVNNNPSIGLAASGSGNIPSFTALSNGANTNVASITVTPVFGTCTGTPKTITITVNPVPDVAQPADQALCSGSNSAAINFTGAVSGTTYNWTNNNPAIGLAASGSGNIPSFAATTSGNSTTTATITVTPVTNSCPGTPKTFTITVNPSPNVLQPADQTLCNNSNTTAINFSGTVSGTVYSWTNNNPSIGLAASGAGNIPAFAASSNGTATNTATITVTPNYNGCSGTPRVFTITVNPMPDVAQPSDQTLCNGSYTSPVNFSGPVAGTLYSWTNTAPSIGLAANGTGNIPSFQAFSNGATVAHATITVKATYNSCAAPAKIFVITVNPLPNVVQPASQAVCNGATINSISFNGNVAGTVYEWTNSNAAIGLPSSGTGTITPFIAVNNTASPITATITVTPVVTSTCSGTPKTFTITINPTPSVDASNNTTVCLGKSVQLNATGATQYTWTPTDHLTCSNCPAPLSTPVDSIIYRVKGTNQYGCPGFDSVVLNVIKPFKMQVSPNDTICVGESINLNAYKANSYLWSPPFALNRVNIPNPTARPNVTTQYRVVGYDGYGCFTDTGYVTIVVGPKPTVNLGPDKVLSTGTHLTLNAITQNGPIISYMWSPSGDLSCNNCATPSTIVRGNSFYAVEVTNVYGCKAVDSIFINSICKSAQVFIPNAFTPDGDGLNDILMVRGRGITVKSFRIFNRWGELVFEKENFSPDDPKFGWDGKVRGVPATPDVFVYTAEVYCDNGIPYTYKGNVTILK
ncbi:PKD domain-containing protein [Ferruginibacter sp.]